MNDAKYCLYKIYVVQKTFNYSLEALVTRAPFLVSLDVQKAAAVGSIGRIATIPIAPFSIIVR